MKNTTYIHLPDLVRGRAEQLVDAGLYGNMSELIREAVRQLIEKQTVSQLDIAIELYKKEKVSLGKAAAIAGLSYDEMLNTLHLRGIQPKFGPETKEEAEEEVGELERLI